MTNFTLSHYLDEIASFFDGIWTRIEPKLAIRTAIAACIGLAVGSHLSLLSNRPDRLLSGMWCVLTAIIVLQAYIGSTYKAAWNRFLGVLIGSLTGSIFTSFMGSNPLTLGISIFFTVIFCSLFYVKESYRIACASAAVITILWGMTPEVSPWEFSLYRFFDSCIGIIIAMAVAHTIWPKEAMEKMRFQLSTLFSQLDLLFDSVLQFPNRSLPAINEEHFHDLNLLIQKNRDLLEESKPDLFTESPQTDLWIFIYDDCQRILECFTALDAVFKKTTREMLDESLLHCIEDKINLIHYTLQSFSQAFSQQKTLTGITLEEGLEELKMELARFRSTHATRGYKLEDVENFFVFCYTLKTLLEILIRIEKNIKKLQISNQL